MYAGNLNNIQSNNENFNFQYLKQTIILSAQLFSIRYFFPFFNVPQLNLAIRECSVTGSLMHRDCVVIKQPKTYNYTGVGVLGRSTLSNHFALTGLFNQQLIFASSSEFLSETWVRLSEVSDV